MCYAQHRFLQLLCGVLAFSVWPQDNSSFQYKWYTYSEGTWACFMYFLLKKQTNNKQTNKNKNKIDGQGD